MDTIARSVYYAKNVERDDAMMDYVVPVLVTVIKVGALKVIAMIVKRDFMVKAVTSAL
jgi:hypothetical protein